MPNVPDHRALPSEQQCEQARLSRDARFDGLFFTAVRSTGIYCRPVCPAPAPKPQHVSYYPTAAAAEAAGFRPCLRCRPELSPADGSWRRGDALLARALKLIESGLLAEQPVAVLAQRLGLSERQLRRVFVDRLGAAPLGVHGTHRLLFAKQLLTETALPITDIALASGFASIRRFNATFLESYRMAPREMRKRAPTAASDRLTLRLNYRPPYAFEAMLEFLRGRALPGVEQVDATGYARLFGTPDAPGWLRVSAAEHGQPALRVELRCPQPSLLPDVVRRLRRMFDLDADPTAIAGLLGRDERLHDPIAASPGLRLPSGWDGFEIAVRAILGQQVSVAAARTLATRLVQRFGGELPAPIDGLTHLFPTPAALVEADLGAIGITRSRADTLRRLARALLDGEIDFAPDRTLDEFVARWTALPGIGAWTAHYVALRALGHPDAYPADDLVLRRMLACNDTPLTARASTIRAECWRPWRGYAVIHLWRHASLLTRSRT